MKDQELEMEDIITRQSFMQSFADVPAPIAIYKGRELKYVFFNNAYAKMFDNRPVPGRTVREAFPDLLGKPYVSILEQVFDTGIPFYGNETPSSPGLDNDGQIVTRYYNMVYTPWRDGTNGILGVIAFGHDVTEQVNARHLDTDGVVLAMKKIEDAEERARLAVESAELGTFEVNLLTSETIATRRMGDIFGVEDPANREQYISAIHPEDRKIREDAYMNAYRTGRLEYEVRVVRKDLSLHWVRVKGRIFFNENKIAVRLLGVAQDITEQKLFAEELSRQVKQRTGELMQAQDNLEKSNSELEQFAYIASHDLQEPLRKIQVFTNMLLYKQKVHGAVRTHIEKVEASAKRMAGLIRNLLEYGRLSRGRLHRERVDLNDVFEQVLSDYAPVIAQKNASVDRHHLPVIEGSLSQINQLFLNLMDNALKFAREDAAPVIRVEADILSKECKAQYPMLREDTDYCRIIFRDNGIGFRQEYASRIFTIFQQLNGKASYDGYGIGLALCRKIVNNHQGLITAEGNLQEGAAFTVILPVERH